MTQGGVPSPIDQEPLILNLAQIDWSDPIFWVFKFLENLLWIV